MSPAPAVRWSRCCLVSVSVGYCSSNPDVINEENLNRIVYARRADIGKLKIDVGADGIERAGLGTEVVRIPKYMGNRA